MEMRYVIFIVGPAESGKSELRRCLNESAGGCLYTASCSDVIYDRLAARRKMHVSDLRRLDKNTIRQELITLGDRMAKHDRCVFVRTLLQRGVQVIDGIRRTRSGELKAALRLARRMGIQPFVVLMARPDTPSRPDNYEGDPEPCLVDFVVTNTAGVNPCDFDSFMLQLRADAIFDAVLERCEPDLTE
jgi:hypothetical protein